MHPAIPLPAISNAVPWSTELLMNGSPNVSVTDFSKQLAIPDLLTTLGGQAFLIALAGTTGSVLAACGVYHFFFKERRRE